MFLVAGPVIVCGTAAGVAFGLVPVPVGDGGIRFRRRPGGRLRVVEDGGDVSMRTVPADSGASADGERAPQRICQEFFITTASTVSATCSHASAQSSSFE